HVGRTQGFSSRTNYSWLFVRASLILANCNLPLKTALAFMEVFLNLFWVIFLAWLIPSLG
ncbi:hypothetical protein CWC14_15065, partial [Pseudoalteromonas sp. S3260]|uniref:hypothetical protein n=1 Tax=Pseudoalteromonas sp. S3260 TaxID=579534 RepID=UPI0012880506